MKATLLILWLYIITVLHGIRVISKKEAQDHFFSKDYTLILKGLCSIIVIFVHVPITYGNKVQDLVGSFAYICVTLFFLFSAYGLRWSFEKKEQYMQHFIKNRIVVLFIPFVIAFLIKKVCGYDVYSGGTMFIYVLLLFYLLTFLSYKLQIRGG